jgi:hypothetical protein
MPVLAELWPQYRLTIVTPRLELRPPREEELGRLAHLAGKGVSRKLGYEPDGISVDARDGEPVVSDRLRLTRQRWTERQHPAVTVHGVAACRAMFGL